MPKTVKLPGNELILWALGIAQTLGFGYALLVYDANSHPAIAGLRGVLLGAALSFGMAVTSQHTPRIASIRARRISYASLIGMLVVAPIIIGPAVYFTIPLSLKLIYPAWLLWVISLSVATAPDLVSIAVASGSNRLQNDGEQVVQRVSKAKPVAPVIPVFVCKKCGQSFSAQKKLNAHGRKHSPNVKRGKGSHSTPVEGFVFSRFENV